MDKGRKVELKKLYYLDHFFEMLDFVLAHNHDLLEERHFHLIERFRSLGLEEQCLYVRLVNRKGCVFRLDRIRYDEIKNLNDSIVGLKQVDLFRELNASDCLEYLASLSRPDLIGLIKALAEEVPKFSSMRKIDLVEWLAENHEFSEIEAHPTTPSCVVLNRCRELEYLFYLYFGRLDDSLTAFALRDLGIVKTRKKSSGFEPRFSSREVALAAFHYHTVRKDIYQADEAELSALASAIDDWPLVDDLEVSASRNKAIQKLGRKIEREVSPDKALPVYLASDAFPSTERAVRILYQRGEKEAAREKLKHLIESPSCDEELIFAEDFYERKFGQRKVGRLTEILRQAEVLSLDESGREYPEAAAVAYFCRKEGVRAFHVENVIWSQLFGLVFWELLFDPEKAAIHGDFDRLPEGLSSEKFYVDNQEEIEKSLSRLKDSDWVQAQSEKVLEQLFVMPNLLLYPDSRLFEIARDLIEAAPEGALEQILRDMAKNFRGYRSGYPDLVVFDEGGVRFVEIKAEGDQIQRHQLAQIEKLKRAGFEVEVVCIKWAVDPEQEYVVVDVETTGGNASWHRVTEIGAVKVRGGKIIDEWSTLLNPERSIPANIISLTGITDEMVASAPIFADVADDFRSFLGEAVFVGHRVKFDFGFIREEFRRIDQDLRAATFCTVVETRRHFPGLGSYGLANLCKEFGIDLLSHHRALCDAKATALILNQINEKRILAG